MKLKKLLKTTASVLLLSLCLTAGSKMITQAAGDDPGTGRLSGEYISEGFYDPEAYRATHTDDNQTDIRWSGASTSQSPYTNKTYTHHSTFDSRTLVHGIDVSQWQGDINWSKVKADGIDFAIIRMGYRGYGSSGTLNTDPYFHTNMKNAIAAGVKVGVYIYSQATTTAEAQEEANYLLNAIQGYTIDMPLVLDYEYAADENGLCGRLYDANLSVSAATKVCNAFSTVITKAGYTPMIYANKSMLEGSLNASTLSQNAHIWLANYTTNTLYGGTFDFWQYSDAGSVDGISGSTDMNFYYKTSTDDFASNTTNLAYAVTSDVLDQTYTGNPVEPPIVVMSSGKTLTRNVDYTVSYLNNTEIGSATLQINGKGNYHGQKNITFSIVPTAVSGLSAKKRTKNYISLKWNTNDLCDGYQIYASDIKYGSYTRIKTIRSNATTTYIDYQVNSGQCYYYKIRGYKKIGSVTYFSNYSPIQTIYTKSSARTAVTKKKAVIYNDISTTGTQALITLDKNTKMSVIYYTKDINDDGWYHVSYTRSNTTYKGFIPASKVKITKTGKVVKTAKVNVRKSYTTASKKLTTLKRNSQVTVLSSKSTSMGKWYKVNFTKNKKTYNGWIYSYYISIK